MGDIDFNWLANLFNEIFKPKKIPDDWRRGIAVSICKNKCNIQNCSNHQEIKLMSHSM